MPKKWKPGDPLEAARLNELKAAARNMIIGGKGIAVTHIGGKVVVSRRPSQIVPKPPIFTGTVFKMVALTGKIKWAFNSGAQVNDICCDGEAVYVAGNRNSTWTGAAGANATVWKLTLNGDFVWMFDTGTLPVFGTPNHATSVISDGTYVYIGAANVSTNWTEATGSAALWKLNCADGTVAASTALPAPSQARSQIKHSLAFGDGFIWQASFGTGGSPPSITEAFIRQVGFDLSELYYARPISDRASSVTCVRSDVDNALFGFTSENIFAAPPIPGSSFIAEFDDNSVAPQWAVGTGSPAGGTSAVVNGAALSADSVWYHYKYVQDINDAFFQFIRKVDRTNGSEAWTFGIDGSSYMSLQNMQLATDGEKVWGVYSERTETWQGASAGEWRNLFCLDADGNLLYTWNNADDGLNGGGLFAIDYSNNFIYVGAQTNRTPLYRSGIAA